MINRQIVSIIEGMPASDGAGVNLSRFIGQPAFKQLDPFLLLDVFKSDNPDDYIAGFPSHPHRGFETVTYMFAGRMRHEDNAGHAGVIETGGVQWMTAGRGIVHSEMPEQESGLMWGCQLWVNLPAEQKLIAPYYQEYAAADIPDEIRHDGAFVKVIAGRTSLGTHGVVAGAAVQPLYIDVHLGANADFVEQIEDGHSVFLLPIRGAVSVISSSGFKTISQGQLAVFGDQGEQLVVKNHALQSRFLLIAGKRLNESVARHGPFVMNTNDEIKQAFSDYHMGRF